MLVYKNYRSPNFENKFIPVEFVLIHYTAQSWKKSLEIFSSESKNVSCHILIDEKGNVYELVSCWEGSCHKAFHAGNSQFIDSQRKEWKQFNDFSIGIELVNWNGNIFNFTESQYQSLFHVLVHLKNIYPSLKNPERILGHEHVSAFRGKKDPGALFDWSKLFQSVYPENPISQNSSVLTKKQCQSLSVFKNSKNWNDRKARQISLLLENTFLPFWLKKILFYLILFF